MTVDEARQNRRFFKIAERRFGKSGDDFGAPADADDARILDGHRAALDRGG